MNKLKFFVPVVSCIVLWYYHILTMEFSFGVERVILTLCKIHKLQKWAIRVISNSYYYSHTASIFQKYNILNVYDSYKLEVVVFMYQYFQNLLPSSFNTFFSKRSDMHDYHTRNRRNFNQTRNKKKFADKTIRTTGPTTWNSIDDKTKKQFQLIIFENLSNHY